MSIQLNQKVIDGDGSNWLFGSLIFSGFFFLPFFFNLESFTAITIIASILIYVIFLVLYHHAACSLGDKAIKPIIAMVVLATVGTYITPGTQALFGFAAFFCGFNFPTKKGLMGLFGIIVATVLAAVLFNYVDAYFLVPPLIISIATFFMGKAVRKDRFHRLKEQRSSEQIEQLAAISERERIARDLHDIVGHSLTSIALKAELAEKMITADKQAQAKEEILAVATLSREILTTIRSAVTDLKNKSLTHHLQQLSQQLEQHDFSVQLSNELSHISAEVESNITLIITEAVTNILKHSSGDKVGISLLQRGNNINVSIEDNGTVSNFIAGNGLNGIMDRCNQLGGTLTTDTSSGCKLQISL